MELVRCCPFCFDTEVPDDETVVTHCGHWCCFNCFNMYIQNTRIYPVPCFLFPCFQNLTDEEIENNADNDTFEYFNETKAYHLCNKYDTRGKYFLCQNIDCSGFFENTSGEPLESFVCPKCAQTTCTSCNAVHGEGETCEQWQIKNQELLLMRKRGKKEDKTLLKKKRAIRCVECNFVISKIKGCNAIRCPQCSTQLCYITKQRRWGPKGPFDTSGGCKCLSDGKTYCHHRCHGCTNVSLFDFNFQPPVL